MSSLLDLPLDILAKLLEASQDPLTVVTFSEVCKPIYESGICKDCSVWKQIYLAKFKPQLQQLRNQSGIDYYDLFRRDFKRSHWEFACVSRVHDNEVWSVAWSSSGRHLFSAGAGGLLLTHELIFDPDTGRYALSYINSLKVGSEITCLSPHPTEEGLVAYTTKGPHRAYIWNFLTRQQITCRSMIYDLYPRWSSDGNALYHAPECLRGPDRGFIVPIQLSPLTSASGSLAIVDSEVAHPCYLTRSKTFMYPHLLEASADGKHISVASGDQEQLFEVWILPGLEDRIGKNPVPQLESHKFTLRCSAEEEEWKTRVEANNCEIITPDTVPKRFRCSGRLIGTHFSNNSKRIAAVLRCWQSPEAGAGLTHGPKSKSPSNPLELSFGTEDDPLDLDGNVAIELWDIESSTLVTTLTGPSAVSPKESPFLIVPSFGYEDQLLACGGEDGQIFVWSLQFSAPLAVIRSHRKLVSCVAVHPKLDLLASASDDWTVAVFQRCSHKKWVANQQLSPPERSNAGEFDRVAPTLAYPELYPSLGGGQSSSL